MSDKGGHRGRGQPRGGGGTPGGFQGGGRGGGGGRGQGFGGQGARGGARGGPPAIFAGNVPAQVPERLSGPDLEKLVNSFKSVTIRPDRPLRPGWGVAGNKITLRANFFPVRVPKGPIYDYVVQISPSTDINRIKARLFDLLERSPLFQSHVPYTAHDRSQRLVSGELLPQPLDIQVPYYEDDDIGPGPNPKTYIISIKFDRELDPRQLNKYMEGHTGSTGHNVLPLVSALNLILQQHASRVGTRVGKNRFFFPSSSQRPLMLAPGIEAIQGFYTSVRPAFKQLMVNVNVCMTAFLVPGNLADRLKEFGQNSRGSMPTLPKSMIKSIRVKTLHLGYKKKLNAIGNTPARNTFFDCEEFGGRISVENYFKRKYNRQLKYPTDLPVVDVGSAKRANWIPAELCVIEPGNAYRGKLSDRETAQMIKYACNPPAVNAEAIMKNGLPILGLVSPPQGPLTGFGVEINTTMAVVPARELLPPKLTYKVGGAPRVQNGSWNILDVKFHRAARIDSWWVLVVKDGKNVIGGPQDPNFMGLVQGFSEKLRKSGVGVPPGLPRLLPPAALPQPRTDPERTLALNTIRNILQTALASHGRPSFVLVLLENRDNFIYPGIKRIGDVELGIHTIHMQLEKALNDPKKQDQYFSNVALKVNTKLGGMNHLLDERAMKWLTKMKTMMVGIDVTHPGPGSREGTPSIAAVVASVDDSFVQFPASIRVQGTKKEMLDELQDMMVERLLVYEKKNKALPARVIVYRDGVSEGQFDTVLEEELPQILSAFKKLNTKERKAYKPQLSIITCGKRHHARFFPTNSEFAAQNGNTRPGTVVDKGVTGVFDFDFYLQAHAGLQGHVKSTHYTVIYDEIGLGADEVQQGTHDVSYLYARATKAVSLIPAAYYADLACERGRCYLNDFLVDDKTSTAGGSTRGRLSKEEEERQVFDQAKTAWGEGLHPNMRDSMFYI